MLKIIKSAGMYRVVFANNEKTVLFSSAVRANCKDFISLWSMPTAKTDLKKKACELSKPLP